MARRCGCASDSCSCTLIAGPGIQIDGTGSEKNNYVISSTTADIETGIDIQFNNIGVINNVHALDFRGTGVTVTPGVDEAVISITGGTGGGGTGTPIPPGTVTMYAGTGAPSGWLLCNGQPVLVADAPDLFAVIGNTYGGDGTTNFLVPNLTGLFVMGGTPSPTPGGAVNNQVTLGPTNLPPHQHTISHTHTLPNHDHNNLITSGGIVPNYDLSAFADGTKPGMGANGQAIRTGGANAGPTNGISTTNSGNGPGTAVPVSIAPRHLVLGYIIKI